MDPWSLFASLVISSVGLGFFLYGKRKARIPQVVVGVGLMVYPYFVGGLSLTVAVGAGLLALLWLALRMGM